MDVLARHYYSPRPDPADFGAGFWDERSDLPGVSIHDAAVLGLLDEAVVPHLESFRAAVPLDVPEGEAPDALHLLNGTYMAVDAHVYWGFVCHFRPRRILEVGAGQSTRLALLAAGRLADRGHERPRLTAVDPFPSAQLLERERSGDVRVLAHKAQDVALDEYLSLGPGDVLFIDSSHVLREGGDVQFLFLEVLPRLQPGVLVHVHDISLPRRYPRTYYEQGLYWTEQYLLQAYLVHNSRVEVIWPGNHMYLAHRDRITAVFPEIARMRERYPASEPTAFWFRVTTSAG